MLKTLGSSFTFIMIKIPMATYFIMRPGAIFMRACFAAFICRNVFIFYVTFTKYILIVIE